MRTVHLVGRRIRFAHALRAMHPAVALTVVTVFFSVFLGMHAPTGHGVRPGHVFHADRVHTICKVQHPAKEPASLSLPCACTLRCVCARAVAHLPSLACSFCKPRLTPQHGQLGKDNVDAVAADVEPEALDRMSDATVIRWVCAACFFDRCGGPLAASAADDRGRRLRYRAELIALVGESPVDTLKRLCKLLEVLEPDFNPERQSNDYQAATMNVDE
jgi:hypothetical protein